MNNIIGLICSILMLVSCDGQPNTPEINPPPVDTEASQISLPTEIPTHEPTPVLPWVHAGGEKIAFVHEGRLHLMNLDGSQREEMLDDLEIKDNDYPHWSPDGKQIVFVSSSGKQRDDIFIVDVHTGRMTNNSNNTSRDFGPSWSPDGTQLVFSSWRERGGYRIYVQDLVGGESEELTQGVYLKADPIWSSDGQAREAISGPVGVHDLLHNLMPVWSPDGERIIYLSGVIASGDWDIHMMNADGSDKVPLIVKFNVLVYPPAWSPDGRYLAFVASSGEGNREIYLWDFEEEKLIRLTNNDFREGSPSWSPDGQWLVFSASRRIEDDTVDQGLYVVRADGSGWAQIPGTGPGDWAPAWQP
jgi:TolB protein